MNDSRLDVRFENPDALVGHGIFWTDDMANTSSLWSPLPVLRSEAETSRVRRVEVQLPVASGRGFLRVVAPQ